MAWIITVAANNDNYGRVEMALASGKMKKITALKEVDKYLIDNGYKSIYFKTIKKSYYIPKETIIISE